MADTTTAAPEVKPDLKATRGPDGKFQVIGPDGKPQASGNGWLIAGVILAIVAVSLLVYWGTRKQAEK